MDLDQVRDEWDDKAGTFDLEADHGLLDDVTRDAWWRTLEPLLPPAPSRIADLGCGTGTVSALPLAEGRWDSGVGLGADALRGMVEPFMHRVEVIPLTDDLLWGNAIDDERFAMLALL